MRVTLGKAGLMSKKDRSEGFEIGDRVRFVSTPYSTVASGETGVVVGIDDLFGVGRRLAGYGVERDNPQWWSSKIAPALRSWELEMLDG